MATKTKLNCVLLIDDNEADNFYHRVIIEQADCAHRIVVKDTAVEALEFLSQKDADRPDLIFLDINMPGMNGWEFLEAYAQLDDTLKGSIIIVMLTTSSDPAERERADNNPQVAGFRTKPLDAQMLDELLRKHFSDRQSQ